VTTPAVEPEREVRPLRITGILPPIPTPFVDGRVDLESLRRLLDYLHPTVDGVLVGGSTGEAASLTTSERESVIRTVAAHLGRDCPLAVSIADNSLETTRRLAEVAGECSASLLVLSCPTYFPNSRAMLEAYFAAVADFASADLCLYDNPIASNTVLGVDDIVALVAGTPQLTHVKMTDTALGKVAALRAAADVTVLAGDDSVLWHQLLGGAEGIMTAIPMFLPEPAAAMWKAFAQGDHGTASARYLELVPCIHSAIASDYPAAVKTVLHSRGLLSSPEVRLPLLPLASERREEVLAAASA
jgi:4-hydroxy-tetrahydrodipicolinate synthase